MCESAIVCDAWPCVLAYAAWGSVTLCFVFCVLIIYGSILRYRNLNRELEELSKREGERHERVKNVSAMLTSVGKESWCVAGKGVE